MNGKLIVGDKETARLFGLRCFDCNSSDTVYVISKPLGVAFPEGAYCYRCLLKRCKATRIIPFPIPQELLDKLKHDMGLPITAVPIKFRM